MGEEEFFELIIQKKDVGLVVAEFLVNEELADEEEMPISVNFKVAKVDKELILTLLAMSMQALATLTKDIQEGKVEENAKQE